LAEAGPPPIRLRIPIPDGLSDAEGQDAVSFIGGFERILVDAAADADASRD
jgi:hypothetical protein